MDATKNYNEDLKDRWLTFKVIALDPWVIFFLMLMFAFYFYSSGSDPSTMKLWSFFIGLSGTVLGARVMKLVREYTEESVLVARGKSAVRSLKTLIRGIYSLEKRADIFLNRLEKGDANELTKNNFEELKTGFNLLQEETINSIENWTDIVPGADIQSQVGIITELKGYLEDKSTELNQLKSNFDEAKGKSNEETEALKTQIKEKEKEISKLGKEIWQKDFNLGLPSPTVTGKSPLLSGLFSEAPLVSLFSEKILNQTSLSDSLLGKEVPKTQPKSKDPVSKKKASE